MQHSFGESDVLFFIYFQTKDCCCFLKNHHYHLAISLTLAPYCQENKVEMVGLVDRTTNDIAICDS